VFAAYSTPRPLAGLGGGEGKRKKGKGKEGKEGNGKEEGKGRAPKLKVLLHESL